jgi:hypothetical protein
MGAPAIAGRRTGTVRAGGTELWFGQRGEGPDVLLIAGLGDPAERGRRSSAGWPTATG